MPISWHLNAIAIPGLRWNSPFGYLVGYVHKTYIVYCEGTAGSTPLERLRDNKEVRQLGLILLGQLDF